jgi:hypothetical protein
MDAKIFQQKLTGNGEGAEVECGASRRVLETERIQG